MRLIKVYPLLSKSSTSLVVILMHFVWFTSCIESRGGIWNNGGIIMTSSQRTLEFILEIYLDLAKTIRCIVMVHCKANEFIERASKPSLANQSIKFHYSVIYFLKVGFKYCSVKEALHYLNSTHFHLINKFPLSLCNLRAYWLPLN